MAIFKYLPGVEVIVTVDRKALEEYTDPDLEEEDKTVTRYIEAQSDATFEIQYLIKKSATRGVGLDFGVFIDGKKADSEIVRSTDVVRGDYTRTSKGWDMSGITARRYIFAKLQTGDMQSMPKISPNRLKDLGTIVIEVYHLSKCTEPRRIEKEFKLAKTITTVSEQAIKGRALSHSVGHGEMASYDTCTIWDVEYFDDDPIATFKFLYRSKEALQQEGIIPRTPSPPPPEERDIDSLSKEEMREMQRQLKALKEQQAAQEAERIKIKREHQDDSPMPKKKARVSEGSEVIELD